MTDKKPVEELIVFPTEVAKKLPEIFMPGDLKKLEKVLAIIEKSELQTFPKSELIESCITLKQIVAYLLLKQGDKYMVYSRNTNDGETRLHKKYGMIGGHINKDDTQRKNTKMHTNTDRFTFEDTILAGAMREFFEEIIILVDSDSTDKKTRYYPTIVGIINTNESLVSQVHFGFIIQVEIPNYVKLRVLHHVKDPIWLTPEEALDSNYEFEAWTQTIFNKLVQKNILPGI